MTYTHIPIISNAGIYVLGLAKQISSSHPPEVFTWCTSGLSDTLQHSRCTTSIMSRECVTLIYAQPIRSGNLFSFTILFYN